jgi:hypothetical protein
MKISSSRLASLLVASFVLFTLGSISLNSSVVLIFLIALTALAGKGVIGCIDPKSTFRLQSVGPAFLFGYIFIGTIWSSWSQSLILWILLGTFTVYGFVIFVQEMRAKPRKIKKSDAIKVSFGATNILLFSGALWTWQRWTPIDIDGNWRYQTDVLYIEALTHSFSVNGPSHSLLSPTDGLNYHWLSYAFSGFLSEHANLPSLYSTNWILPLIIYFLITKVVSLFDLSHEKDHLERKNTILFLVVIGIGFEIPSWIPLGALSTAFALPLLALIVLVITQTLNGKFHLRSTTPILFLLMFGLVGTKVHAAILLVSTMIGLAVLMSLNQGRKRSKEDEFGKLLLILFTLLVGFFFGYWNFFYGESRDFPVAIGISINSLSLIPLCLLVHICVADFNLKTNENRLSVFFIVFGSLLSTFTVHWSGNEIWFIYAAFPVSLMLSINIKKVQYCRTLVTNKVQAVTILFISLTLASLWKVVENLNGDWGRSFRSLIELVLPSFCLLVWMLRNKSVKAETVKVLSTLLGAAAIGVATCSLAISLFTGPIYSKSESIFGYGPTKELYRGSVSISDSEAGDWVRRELPKDVLFITNRFCVDAEAYSADCNDTWAAGSAFSRRNFLLDGAGYVSKEYGRNTGGDFLRVNLDQWFSEPNELFFTRLKELGVTHIWLDHRAGFNPEILKYTNSQFRSNYIEILALN